LVANYTDLSSSSFFLLERVYIKEYIYAYTYIATLGLLLALLHSIETFLTVELYSDPNKCQENICDIKLHGHAAVVYHLEVYFDKTQKAHFMWHSFLSVKRKYSFCDNGINSANIWVELETQIKISLPICSHSLNIIYATNHFERYVCMLC